MLRSKDLIFIRSLMLKQKVMLKMKKNRNKELYGYFTLCIVILAFIFWSGSLSVIGLCGLILTGLFYLLIFFLFQIEMKETGFFFRKFLHSKELFFKDVCYVKCVFGERIIISNRYGENKSEGYQLVFYLNSGETYIFYDYFNDQLEFILNNAVFNKFFIEDENCEESEEAVLYSFKNREIPKA